MSEEIICPYCSAPIRVTAYENVITCPYCGTTFVKGGEVVKDHRMGMINYSPKEIFEIFKEWALRKPETPDDISVKASMTNYELTLYPYWVFRLDVKADYSAYKRKSSRVVNIEHETLTIAIPAAKEMLATVLSDYEFSVRGKIYYNSQVVQSLGAKVLNANISLEEAKERAFRKALDFIREKLERTGLTKIKFNPSTKVDIEDVTYVHIPIYKVFYRYGGRQYYFLADASDSKIIYAEIPTGKVFRVISIGAALASLVFAGIIFFIGLSLHAICFATYSGFLMTLISAFMFLKSIKGVVVVAKHRQEADTVDKIAKYLIRYI
ncbi:MAG: hypothetical protein DRJ38_09555 [Thermoprotei archaeon]|nr:MAG: hypothetical protein DRJ38_09555 [Thermoprotei archaeon]